MTKSLRELGFAKKKKNNEIINEIKNRIKFFTKKKYILEKKVSFFFSENLIFENYGVFKIKKEFFFKTNNEIQIEILKKILVTNSGFSYSPKLSSLKLIINNIRKNRNSQQTLHSSIIFVKDNLINICREGIGTQRNNPICLKVKSSNKILWDERFVLETKKYDLTCELIDAFKWNSIKKLFFDKKKRKLPMLILKTLPLINNGNEKFIPFVNSKYYLKKNGINFYFSPRIPLTLN